MKIGIIGIGYVGLSFAAALGSKKFEVLAVDSNEKKIKSIRSGRVPFHEPDLQKLLLKSINRYLKVLTDIGRLVRECKLIFITVGTPSLKDGSINLNDLKTVAKTIGTVLAKSKNRPLIIIKSTVIPGTTQRIKEIIENYSKKKSEVDFFMLTNPEFLREGRVVEDTFHPHMIVIGGYEEKSMHSLKKFYDKFHQSKVSFVLTNPQTAEMIKYANNSFLATKLSFINQISNICEKIPGVNVDKVAKAIGLDPRIGSQFLMAGPGFGGSCLPKDLKALISFSSQIRQSSTFLKAVNKTNTDQALNLVSFLKKIIKNLKRKRVTILGLSFKEDSDDVRESASIKLIELLLKQEAKIVAHDPRAIENTKKIIGNKISYQKSVKGALRNSDCAIIMTPWKQYTKLTNNDFQNMKKRILVDTRRLLSNKRLNVKYYATGIGSE